MIKIIFKNKTIQKVVSLLMIVAIFLPSVTILTTPKKTSAAGIPVTDIVGNILKGIGNAYEFVDKTATLQNTAISLKNVARELLRLALQIIAKKALAEMTKSTVNWINTGRFGKPLFIENTKTFFEDIGKGQIKSLVNNMGYDPLHYPFAKNYLLGVIGSYKRSLQDNAAYSLSLISDDEEYLRSFREDFNVGGWDGFFLNTQYQQNNALGYMLMVNDGLSQRVTTATQKVDNLLLQGQGFLSPQVCPDNPKYPKFTNPYNPPSFNDAKYEKEHPYTPPNFRTNAQAFANYEKKWLDDRVAAKATFEKDNSCPGGLVSTTPGAVVANSIMTALDSGYKQGELSAAFGNSLSSIFNALLNKYLNKGLNYLATKTNIAEPDNFSYYGETLGSPTDSEWSNGPDQEIIVSDFKKEISGKTLIFDPGTDIVIEERVGNTGVLNSSGNIVWDSYNGRYDENATVSEGNVYVPGAIINTKEELALISNSSETDPGIIEVLQRMAGTTKSLDRCLPGPNKNWENRLQTEFEKNTNKILEAAGNTTDSADAVRELKYAVGAFKDWLITKMIESLPNAILYMDAIKQLDSNSQEFTELTDKRRAKTVAVARLRSIELALKPVIEQPQPGSVEEQNMITIWKQFDAIRSDISSSSNIEDTRSRLDLAREKVMTLLALNSQCTQERSTAGWINYPEGVTHGSLSFLPEYKNKPYRIAHLNGAVRYSAKTNKNDRACWATINERKFVVEPSLNQEPGEDTCGPLQPPYFTEGTEIEQFCELPIIGGHSHGVLDGNIEDTTPVGAEGAIQPGTNHLFIFNAKLLDDTKPRSDLPNGVYDLPMVNGEFVLNYYKKIKRIIGHSTEARHVDVDIDCDTIYFSNDLDYSHAGDDSY